MYIIASLIAGAGFFLWGMRLGREKRSLAEWYCCSAILFWWMVLGGKIFPDHVKVGTPWLFAMVTLFHTFIMVAFVHQIEKEVENGKS